MAKELRELVRNAESQGWRSQQIKSGLMLLAPDGVGKVVVHGTNSDRRALSNLVAVMRRHGFVWK